MNAQQTKKSKSVPVKQVNKKNLRDSAVLCSIRFRTPCFRSTDNKLRAENENKYKAENKSTVSKVYIVSDIDRRGLKNGQARIKLVEKRYTLPFQQGGFNLIPLTIYDEFSQKLNAALEYYNEQRKVFLDDIYPQVIKRHKERLGDLAERHPLPTVEQMAAKIGVDVTITKLPEVPQNFISQLVDSQATRIVTTENMVENAISKLLKEVEKVISKIADKDSKITKSTVKSLKALSKKLKTFNITDNPDIEQIRLDSDSLSKIDSTAKGANKQAQQKAQQIIKTIKSAKTTKRSRKIDLDIE